MKKHLKINWRSFDQYVKVWLMELNSFKPSMVYSGYQKVKRMFRTLFNGYHIKVENLVNMGLPIHTNFFTSDQLAKLIEIQCSLRPILNSTTFFLWNTVMKPSTFCELLALEGFDKIVLIE